MKRVSFFSVVLVALAFASMSFIDAAPVEDVSKSEIIWKGYKVTGSHEGTIQLKSGDLKFNDAGQLTGGEFVVDMTSMKCTDLKGESAGKLMGHLKSPDFFGVDNHPTSKLVITKVASQGKPGEYKITGDLTIKEITKPIKFFTKVTEKDGMRVATSEITVDRSEYNVRYGSGSFFDNLGDNTIYDEFDLEVVIAEAK